MREKLIDIVEAYADFLDWDTKEEMVDSIMEFLATDNNVGHKWISVKDRLPEHGDIVLCHTKHDDLLVFQWCEMSHRWVDQYEDYRQDYITHWMPLPQPPKGE